MAKEQEPQARESWLARKLLTMDALYRRFGRDGLKDHSMPDVDLLLASKRLQFRDSAKSPDLGEDQKAANRQLELEIKDLTAYLKGQVASISLSDLRNLREPDRFRQSEPHKKRDIDLDRS